MPSAELLSHYPLHLDIHQKPIHHHVAINLPDSDLDYDSRRMSSISNPDTESGSILSKGDTRSLTPVDTASLPDKRDSVDRATWDVSHSPSDRLQNENTMDHKVQLPSISTTFEDSHLHDSRRSSLPVLHSDNRVRHNPYPTTSLRQTYTPSGQSSSSSLSSYTFPSSTSDRVSTRPRVTTDLGSFNGNGSHVNNSYDSPYPNSGSGVSPYSESETWNSSASGIIRPSSTPGQLSSSAVRYEDSLRHASFSGAPMSQAQMFAGSGRISGQHDRKHVSSIKGEWSFPNQDFVLSSGNPQYSPSLGTNPPAISVAPPASRSPPSAMPSSSLVDRPQRKRGKLPKETTDYLKAWLHRHSDHPYPSEEEKKQLCHATGLSMSQVSNWMINARRRILAPAHRASSGPTTTAPFPPSGRSASLSGLLDPMSRRGSMPGGPDTLQLYPPMTLQSVSNNHHSSSYSGSTTRHLVSSMPPRSHNLAGEYAPSSRHMNGYSSGQGGGSGHNGHYMSSEVGPLSAPPSLSNNPFSSHNSHHHSPAANQGVYSSLMSSPRSTPSGHHASYFNDTQSHSNSNGSGYGTPP